MNHRAMFATTAAFVLIACASARGPVAGGPCEYESYEGKCVFSRVRSDPNSSAPELSWAHVQYDAEGSSTHGMSFEDTFSLPTRELNAAEQHYRAFRRVDCKGARIRHGTCSPQEGGFSLPRFRFPGTPTDRGCSGRADCETGCKKGSHEDCERAGYNAWFGIDGQRDLSLARAHYRSALEHVVDMCRSGHGAMCGEAATYFELDLVGGTNADENRTTLLQAACKLGEPWACAR